MTEEEAGQDAQEGLEEEQEEEELDDESNIPHALFQAFCDEKNLEGPCDRCGHSAWLVETDISTAPFNLRLLTMPDRHLRGYIPFIIMFCGNCGNTKQFHLEPIKAWRRVRG